MVPYILMFGLSCLNFRLAYLLRKYKTIKILFVLIGLLLPCILAGARDNTIGTDMLVYGDAYLNYAQRYNTLSSFMNFNYLGGEPLFKILSYISAHYFGQFGYYFALEFACILPVYATFVRRGWEKYSWLGMLIYYLCFYSFSLNLLRQSIAMSIIFWGYNYIVERKPIKFCVSVVIAAGFHLTAAIMLLLYPIHRMVTYVQDKDSKNIFSRIIGPYRKLIYALIILLCVAVLFLYSSLLPIIIALTGTVFNLQAFKKASNIYFYNSSFYIYSINTESVTNQCTANFDRKAERVFKLFNEVLSDCLTDKIKIGLQYKGLCLYTQFLQVDCFNIGIKDNFRHRMTRSIEVCKKNFFPSMVTDIYNYMSNYERLTWKAVKLKSPFLIFVFYKIRMRKLKEKR